MKNEQRRRNSYMNRLRSDTSNDPNPIIEVCVPGRLATFFEAKNRNSARTTSILCNHKKHIN